MIKSKKSVVQHVKTLILLNGEYNRENKDLNAKIRYLCTFKKFEEL